MKTVAGFVAGVLFGGIVSAIVGGLESVGAQFIPGMPIEMQQMEMERQRQQQEDMADMQRKMLREQRNRPC